MANVLDYVKWRGDLPFEAVPFCEVDALVFAELTFLEYSGCCDAAPGGRAPTLGEIVEAFFSDCGEEEISLGKIIPGEIVELFRLCGTSARYSSCRVAAYVNIHDEENVEQFCACTFLVPDGSIFAAFRGTDDTIVGWKENFQMTFRSPVPAQEHAAKYLSEVGKYFPIHALRLGGHSKGGNLAVWAASHASPEVRKRIIRIYNLDGPGFRPEIEKDSGFEEIRPRIRTIVPECSVVGMLLDHDEKYYAVKSTNKGIMQHDGMSWQVLGGEFVPAGEISRDTLRVNRLLSAWIGSMDDECREKFTEAFFNIVYSTKAGTLTELADKLPELFRAFSVADAETRHAINAGMRLLLGESKRTVSSWAHRHLSPPEKPPKSDDPDEIE